MLEDAGIITNMNMLPGDTKAMTPSGLRLGVQELTRVGMGPTEMEEVAKLYGRVLLQGEDPSMVKKSVARSKENSKPFDIASTKMKSAAIHCRV
ncbi:MAG: hypothetical protein Ct9H90mP16_02980 [Candidatus Poseidoniales archaeon]|nr:MAG: hypothetical protein Ct9H90mP16_02980 [Candidatus Poseidoniales archaeon]